MNSQQLLHYRQRLPCSSNCVVSHMDSIDSHHIAINTTNPIISKTAAASKNRANMCRIWPNGPNSFIKHPGIVNHSLHQPYCRIWSNPTLIITKFTWEAVNPMPLRTVLYSQLLPINTSLTSHRDRRVQYFGIQPIGIYTIDVAAAPLLICIKTPSWETATSRRCYISYNTHRKTSSIHRHYRHL